MVPLIVFTGLMAVVGYCGMSKADREKFWKKGF